MKNENHSSYEQGKMHSTFFILHFGKADYLLPSPFKVPLALRRGVRGEARGWG